MRTRFVIAAASIAGAAALGVVLAACGDLFHGTDDIKNLCELEAGVEGCGVDAATVDTGAETAAPDAGFALCLTNSAGAKARAETACKWLGACETPIGRNRFATCMVDALSTYDCNITPNRKPNGKPADYWKCLAQVDSCAKVDACVFTTGHNLCPDGGVLSTCDPGRSPGVRNVCNGSNILRGEACFATGRSCADGIGLCLGESSGGSCTTGCFGKQLHDCDDAGVNVGVDCNVFGAQACVSSGSILGCKAQNGNPCTATTAVTCTSGGIATGCPSGVEETVQCRSLTGQTACDPGAPGPLWDVSRVCFNTGLSLPCSPTPDSCAGNQLSSCIGGVTYTTTCSAPYTGCATSPPTADGANARCTLPADAGR